VAVAFVEGALRAAAKRAHPGRFAVSVGPAAGLPLAHRCAVRRSGDLRSAICFPSAFCIPSAIGVPARVRRLDASAANPYIQVHRLNPNSPA
jgi:hypothetical protein